MEALSKQILKHQEQFRVLCRANRSRLDVEAVGPDPLWATKDPLLVSEAVGDGYEPLEGLVFHNYIPKTAVPTRTVGADLAGLDRGRIKGGGLAKHWGRSCQGYQCADLSPHSEPSSVKYFDTVSSANCWELASAGVTSTRTVSLHCAASIV